MRSPTLALMWFLWLRSRLWVAVLALLCIALPAVSWLTMWLRGRTGIDPGISYGLRMIIAVVCSIMTVLEADQRSRMEISPHILAMPVGNRKLTLAHFGFSWLAAFVMGCFGMLVMSICFGSKAYGAAWPGIWAWWHFPLFCACLAVLIQSFWVLDQSLGFFWGGVWAAGLFLLAMACIILPAFPFVDAYAVPLWLFSAVVAYGVHARGFSRIRYQCKEDPWPIMFEKLRIGQGRTKPFPSADRALVWYMWQRYSLVMFAVVAGLMLVSTPFLLATGRGENNPIDVALLAAIPVFALLGTIAAFASEPQLLVRAPGFLMAQPVRTTRFAHAILIASAGMLALVFLILAPALMAILRAGLPEPAVLKDRSSVLFIWAATLSCSWLVLWYSLPGFYVIGGIVLLSYAAQDRLGVPAPIAGGCLAAALFLLVVCAAIRTGLRRRYFEKRTFVGMAIVAAVYLALVLMLVLSDNFGARPFNTETGLYYAALFAATLVVVMPFIHVPLAMDWFRHR